MEISAWTSLAASGGSVQVQFHSLTGEAGSLQDLHMQGLMQRQC